MKLSSLKQPKFSNRKVKFLLPLAFFISHASFFISSYAPLPAVAQITDVRKTETDRLLNQGVQQYQTSQFEAAIISWQQALQMYRAIKNQQGEGKALVNLGSAYYSLGNYTKAIEYYQQSLAIAREIKDRQGEGRALDNLGTAYNLIGNYAKAIEYSQQRLAIAREIKDRQGEGRALGNLRNAYRSLGDHTNAIEYSQQRLAIADELKDQQVAGKILEDLRTHYRPSNNYFKAVETYRQWLAITRKLRSRQGQGFNLDRLGTAYRSLDNPDKVIEYAQQSLAIAREFNDRESEGNALSNLGVAYNSLANYSKAIEYAQKRLAIAREIKDRRGEGDALGILANTYSLLGDYSKAIEHYQQWLVITREVKNRRSEGIALGNLGSTYSMLGNYTKAIEYRQQWLAITREIKNRRDEGIALGSLGNAYSMLGNYSRSIEYLQQGLVIARKVKNRRSESTTLTALGTVYYFLGDYAKAIEYHQQSLAIAHKIKDRRLEGYVLNSLGDSFLKLGNLPSAEKALLSAIQVRESIRGDLGNNDNNKISIFEQQATSYRALQEVLIRQNKITPALEIAERGRGRAFVELLAQRLSTGSSNVSSGGLTLAAAPTQSQIRQIAKMQNATLVQYSIIYETIKIQGKPSTRESALYIWVIQPTGDITFRQVDLKPLWQRHNNSLAKLTIEKQEFLAVRSRGSNSTRPQANLPTLHQLLIEPIAPLLPKNPTDHVIFIPQGALFQVPFPALQDDQGNYLIQKHTILTAPSIQVLALTRQQRQKLSNQKPGRAIVLGNPTMPSVSPAPGAPERSLSPLPGAEIEAKAIAPLLNTQAILGAQGTKAAIVAKMPQASIIHFATHGLLDDVRGLESAIALAPSGKDNGLLSAEEILDMRLKANLVVLSACNTAQGRTTGDGIIGLSRAFISAGVPSVIVSLWSVPDAPTAELMQSFYQNLQKNPDKAQALRQAMLTTMKTHPQPRDWAAFTLIGEAE
ncbi:CHAT domain-containing tetratricopeptide repeat protein [Phormidesmis sp. 146-35]